MYQYSDLCGCVTVNHSHTLFFLVVVLCLKLIILDPNIKQKTMPKVLYSITEQKRSEQLPALHVKEIVRIIYTTLDIIK